MQSTAELWSSFVAHVASPAAWGDAGGGAALAAAYDKARAAWPRIELDPVRFARHLAERWPADEPPDLRFAAVNLGDLYLACACLHGDPAAIRALEAEHLGHVPAWLASLRAPPAVIEDVQQDLRARLLSGSAEAPPKIGEYAGRGALRVWLRAAAVRAALNQLDKAEVRKRAAGPEDDDWMARVPGGGDPQLDVARRIDRAAFQGALREALAALDAEQRNLLRLHYLDGLTVEQIGAAFQVHKSTISRRLAAAREAIAAEARRLLGQRLRLRPEEVDSLGGLLHSQLDLSLSRILRQP